MAVRIKPISTAGQFLQTEGVTEDVLNAATFRVLNWQAGAAITVMLPFGRAAIFVKSKYLPMTHRQRRTPPWINSAYRGDRGSASRPDQSMQYDWRDGS